MQKQLLINGANSMANTITGTGYIEIEPYNISKICLIARMILNEPVAVRIGGFPDLDTDKLKSACKKQALDDVFECWGFWVNAHVNEKRYISFKGTRSDQDFFLSKIAPFITRGQITWVSEEGLSWSQEFRSGQSRKID